jgi:hypothetical protein
MVSVNRKRSTKREWYQDQNSLFQWGNYRNKGHKPKKTILGSSPSEYIFCPLGTWWYKNADKTRIIWFSELTRTVEMLILLFCRWNIMAHAHSSDSFFNNGNQDVLYDDKKLYHTATCECPWYVQFHIHLNVITEVRYTSIFIHFLFVPNLEHRAPFGVSVITHTLDTR